MVVATIDSLNLFDDRPYKVVPHGDHVHYMPHDRDPEAHLDDFPMQPPGPNQKILPDGRVVPK